MPTIMQTTLRKWRSQRHEGKQIACALCHEIMDTDTGPKGPMTVDHIVPKSLGGRNTIRNFQPAHRGCNFERGNLIMREFRGAKTQQEIVRRAISIIDHARPIPVAELLRKV